VDLHTQWKVVIIDDEEDIREVLTVFLEDAGYRVAAAADGAAGLQLCESIHPQIVITDVRMPGMDGLGVLERVKAAAPDTEVIVATAFGEMDLAIRALQLDASDFITKPIGDTALNLALDRAKTRYTSRRRLLEYAAVLEAENAATSQELIQSISFQKRLIEASMDGILGCDAADRVAICNRSMADMTGYAGDEVVQKMRLADFFPPEALSRFEAALGGEKFGGRDKLLLFETAVTDKAGREIPVQVSATVMLEDRKKSGIVCFFRDLRKIRELEREMADQAHILHQDKMMSLGRLAASVVHEINNPLSGVLNYLRLMARIVSQGPLSEERRRKFSGYLSLVETETERCSRIVANLLGFARMAPPQIRAVSIDDLLQRCTLLSHHRLELSGIRLDTEIRADLPPVEGDVNQLQQCIINLIFNAVDAMPDGGVLTIGGRCDARRQVVRISLKDTGAGIAPEDLPHIFEPFYTTKPMGYGVGLGLATVYGIIERHRGTIKVDSRPGQGSEFVLELPAMVPDRKPGSDIHEGGIP